MNCSKCETALVEGANFCFNCGQPVPAQAQPTNTEKSATKKIVGTIVYECHLSPEYCGGHCEDTKGICDRSVALL
jgi:hypothetical protein